MLHKRKDLVQTSKLNSAGCGCTCVGCSHQSTHTMESQNQWLELSTLVPTPGTWIWTHVFFLEKGAGVYIVQTGLHQRHLLNHPAASWQAPGAARLLTDARLSSLTQ